MTISDRHISPAKPRKAEFQPIGEPKVDGKLDQQIIGDDNLGGCDALITSLDAVATTLSEPAFDLADLRRSLQNRNGTGFSVLGYDVSSDGDALVFDKQGPFRYENGFRVEKNTVTLSCVRPAFPYIGRPEAEQTVVGQLNPDGTITVLEETITSRVLDS